MPEPAIANWEEGHAVPEGDLNTAVPAENRVGGNLQHGELRQVFHKARKRLDHISGGRVSEGLAELLEEELS